MTDMDKMMIEKVARAIYDAAQAEAVRRGHDADTLPTYDTDDEEARSACLELARAAIAAYNPDDRLREALEGMVGLVELICERRDLPPDFRDAAEANHRMIAARAALSPLPQGDG